MDAIAGLCEDFPTMVPLPRQITYRRGVGSAICSFDDQGRHRIFEKAFRKDLPQSDVWLILSTAGFASDKESWDYEATR